MYFINASHEVYNNVEVKIFSDSITIHSILLLLLLVPGTIIQKWELLVQGRENNNFHSHLAIVPRSTREDLSAYGNATLLY